MKYFIYLAILFTLAGCSSQDDPVLADHSVAPAHSIQLPANSSEKVVLRGAMDWWFWEGDAGCFATLVSQGQKVELWSSADLCEHVDYKEGQQASVEITYQPKNQYSNDGATIYTVIRFL